MELQRHRCASQLSSKTAYSFLPNAVLFLVVLFGGGLVGTFVGCGGGSVDSVSNADPAKVNAQPDVVSAKGDWPWWSGPDRDFSAALDPVIEKVGEDQNLRWKTTLVGEGHASPIVVGDKVLIARAIVSNSKKGLACYSRSDGKLLWETTLHEGPFMKAHNKNSQASSTPASDGRRIFTAFMFDNAIQASAVDLDGKILWQNPVGSFTSRFGYGSSVCLYKSLLIVAGDNPGSSFLAALDRETGKIAWRVQRTNGSSYATPSVVKQDGKATLLISGADKIQAYDPASGRELWSTAGPASTTANTLSQNGNLIYSGGGYPQHRVFAIDSETQEKVWQADVKNYCPSPVVFPDCLVVPQDNGILNGLDLKTGEELWRIRLGEDLSGSPIRVGTTAYLGGEKGTLFVIDCAEGRILEKNRLDSRIMTTPAICGNQIFVRTDKSLYCFEQTSPEVASKQD